MRIGKKCIRWARVEPVGVAIYARRPGGPTFLDALKDQLGLKLTPATGEIGTLIIDHIERPSVN